MAEHDRRIDEQSRVVRAAVSQNVGHPSHERLAGGKSSAKIQHTGDAAHVSNNLAAPQRTRGCRIVRPEQDLMAPRLPGPTALEQATPRSRVGLDLGGLRSRRHPGWKR